VRDALVLTLLGLAACKPGGSSGPWMARAHAGDELWATIETNQGTMVAKLYAKDAPKTVENFVGLATGEKEWKDPVSGQSVQRPLYDKTIFHRVIPGFMIPGRRSLGNGTADPATSSRTRSRRRASSTSRACWRWPTPAGDQRQPVLRHREGDAWLDGKHTIFGELVSGCDNVFKIARVPARASRPVEPVVVEHIAISDKQ